MLHAEDEALAAAVEDAERTPLWELEADWSGTGRYAEVGADLSDVVDRIAVERTVSGELPDTAGEVDGFVAATLEATLSGYREDADEHIGAELSRWNPRGLRRGRALITPNVRASFGLATDDGPRLLRKFTGYGRKLDHDEEDGTVDLAGVDRSERLRALITLPTYGEFVNHARRRPWALTVNTQWILDYCLRRNGIFASPPFREDATVACTGHGGLVAERGFNGAPISIYGDGPKPGLWVEDQNPWGMLGTPEGRAGGTAAYQEFYGAGGFRFEAGQGFGLAAHVHISDLLGLGASFENRLFQVRPTGRETPRLFVNAKGDGKVYAGMVGTDGTIVGTNTLAVGPEPWHFLGFHWRMESATSMRVTVCIDDWVGSGVFTIPRQTVPAAPADGCYLPVHQVNGQCFRSWMLLQGWLAYAAPTAAEWAATRAWDHESEADIARGLNEMLYLPDVANADAWDVMRDAVAAEFGVHGFQESDRYRFRPRADVRSEHVDVELDVDTNLLGVGYSEDADSARNVVGFKTTARYHTADMRTVVKAKDVEEFVCPVGRSTFVTDWPHGAAGYQSGVLPYCYQRDAETAARDADYWQQWDGDVVHGYTYSSRGASGGWTILDNNRSVVVRYQQVDARSVVIYVDNPGPGSIRLATAATLASGTSGPQDGEPALRIAGWPLEEEFEHVEEVRDEDAILRHGHERGLALADNDYRHTSAAVRPLASAILAALVDGPVILEDLPVIGDPRVQAGDVARCTFRDTPVPLLGTVVKVRDVVDRGDGYGMDVSVRLLPGQAPEVPDDGAVAPPGWTFYLDISHHQGNSPALDLERVHALGYGGLVARIGQGGGTYVNAQGTTVTHGQVADTWWTTWRDEGRRLWPDAFAGYWYVGNVETPQAQAQRCRSLMGDPTIPVMLDWEDGAGDFANLLAVLDAFRAAGLLVTMVYAGRGYANANAPAGSTLAGRGVSLVSARYWINDPEGTDPRYAFEDQREGFGFEPFLGLTPAANQFTQYGRVYPGRLVDVNAYPGTPAQLGRMFRGE